MINAEQHTLHNLFIKYRKENKALDEIKSLLKVDDETLIIWEVSFQTILENIPTHVLGMNIKVDGVDERGTYTYSTSASFQSSLLETAKIELQKAILVRDNFPDWGDKAEKYLSLLEQYVLSIDEIKRDKIKGGNIKCKLNTQDEDIIKAVREALDFWAFIHFGIQDLEASKLIDEPSNEIFTNANKKLDYALKQVQIKDFEEIRRISIEHIPIDTNFIFLIGENGYGKTSILRSIAISLFGDKDEDGNVLLDGYTQSISCEYSALGKAMINNIHLGRYTPIKYLACYGASRLQIQTDQTQNDIAKKSTTTYSLFNSDGILLNIEYELLLWYLEKNPRFDATKQIFLNLIPYLSDIQVDVPNRKILYTEKEPAENGGTYLPVRFEQLASGFRSIIAMVGDMMIRLFKTQPTIINPSELSGIVIIDELDLHLHPKIQRQIPKLLSSIFPKVQFIVSTHSLVPLLGAPENSVLLKVNRDTENGITAEKMDIDFQALSTDTIFRDIFGIDYMSDAKTKAWERFIELKGMEHFEKNEAQKKEYWKEIGQLADKYQFEI